MGLDVHSRKCDGVCIKMNIVSESTQSSQIVYVVYDSKNGKIIHIHRYLVVAGAELPNEDERIGQALETARKLGCRESLFGMSAICVPSEDLKPRVYYEVDLLAKKLTIKSPPNFETAIKTIPLDILKLRLAKGEISKEEYYELCKIVERTNR